LTPHLKPIAARILLAILAAMLSPMALAQQTIPRTVILLDPAHGGPDNGAHLNDNLPEKSFTLTFAARLRAILIANSFSVISTRDSDPSVPFTTDQRADIANHSHPTLCLLLHATSSGNGVHLVTSSLTPPDDTFNLGRPHPVIPWDTAQAASVPQSLRLANELGLALLHAKLPVLLTRASVRPIDNLTCPAVAIEIAPFAIKGSVSTPVTDTAYQQQIAQSIAAGLASWRSQAIAAAAAAAAAGATQ
jgi:N-acetylmuramoyl-L-alanine amidase